MGIRPIPGVLRGTVPGKRASAPRRPAATLCRTMAWRAGNKRCCQRPKVAGLLPSDAAHRPRSRATAVACCNGIRVSRSRRSPSDWGVGTSGVAAAREATARGLATQCCDTLQSQEWGQEGPGGGGGVAGGLVAQSRSEPPRQLASTATGHKPVWRPHARPGWLAPSERRLLPREPRRQDRCARPRTDSSWQHVEQAGLDSTGC